MPGTLYICPTPIGNLEDMSIRILRTLTTVDLIAAEDTRVTLKLLNAFGASRPLTSYHEHNKAEKGPILIQKLIEGDNIALVSDAGTPAISDPGEDLVKLAIEAGIEIVSLPGPCACVTAISTSGLSTRRFVFEGFLPRVKKDRKNILESLKTEVHTIVLYESPHHLLGTLKDLYETLGDRKISISRELSKKYEHTYHFTLPEAVEYFINEEPKGEFVLIVEAITEKELLRQERKKWLQLTLEEHMDIYLSQGMPKKEAMKKVAEDRGIPKRDIYQALL